VDEKKKDPIKPEIVIQEVVKIEEVTNLDLEEMDWYNIYILIKLLMESVSNKVRNTTDTLNNWDFINPSNKIDQLP